MANHKSSIKRIRSGNVKKERNSYYHKTTRNALRKLRSLNNRPEAEAILPQVVSLLDKLTKRRIIHRNKAANLKSSVQLQLNKLK